MTLVEDRTLSQHIADLETEQHNNPREQWCVGYDEGYRRGYDVGTEQALRNIPQHLIEDAARELLARDAAEFRAAAVAGALERRGLAWAALIDGQAQP